MPRPPPVDISLLFGSLATWSTLRQNVPGSDVGAGHRPAINVGTFLNLHCQILQQVPLEPSGLPRPFQPRSKVYYRACVLPPSWRCWCTHTAADWKSESQPVRHQTAGWLFCIHFLLHTHFLEPPLDCLASTRYRISAVFIQKIKGKLDKCWIF